MVVHTSGARESVTFSENVVDSRVFYQALPSLRTHKRTQAHTRTRKQQQKQQQQQQKQQQQQQQKKNVH